MLASHKRVCFKKSGRKRVLFSAQRVGNSKVCLFSLVGQWTLFTYSRNAFQGFRHVAACQRWCWSACSSKNRCRMRSQHLTPTPTFSPCRFQKYGGHFSEKKKRLRQRRGPFRASRNMGVIFLKKKAPAATYPQIQGFQKYGAIFLKKKSACGNVVGHPGLPENPRVSRGPHFHPHPQVPRLM